MGEAHERTTITRRKAVKKLGHPRFRGMGRGRLRGLQRFPEQEHRNPADCQILRAFISEAEDVGAGFIALMRSLMYVRERNVRLACFRNAAFVTSVRITYTSSSVTRKLGC